jgi:3-methyladenine DNA glycosylase AlkD
VKDELALPEHEFEAPADSSRALKQKAWMRNQLDLFGSFMKFFPKEKPLYANKWLSLENTWLQRAALLFQLKYKAELDTAILSPCIDQLLEPKEIFLNKAKGWVLSAYSRTLIGQRILLILRH